MLQNLSVLGENFLSLGEVSLSTQLVDCIHSCSIFVNFIELFLVDTLTLL
jgi:hypothetical protein